jgi:hypothetical protein
MKRLTAILIGLFTLTTFSYAQKFTTTVSKSKVAVGEGFQIQFSLNGNGAGMKLPNLSEFDVMQGPFQSSSTSWINGVMTQSTSITYVLAAKREGKFTIGPASVNVNGTAIQSNAVTIEVVKGNAGNQAQSNPNQNTPGVSPPSADMSNNIFIRAVVNKSNVYLGEDLLVTFKLYTRLQFYPPNITAMPSFDGFYIQEGKADNTEKSETIDGVSYAVFEFRRQIAIPQRTGKLTIDPVEMECVVHQRSNRKPRDIFEQMMGAVYEDVSVKLKSKPVTIEVMPLPEANKPSSFSGAVGDYSYKVELTKDHVKANEAVNLIITLSGKGNIKLVETPKIQFPEDFETYDPTIKENISAGAIGINGSKTFNYLVIPRHEGEYKIDNLNFTFFNPAKSEYVTIPSPELQIHVDKGDENSASANVYTPANKSEIREIGTDIRYIKTGHPELKDKNDYFFNSVTFWTGVISPFLAFFGFMFYRRKTIEANKDVIAVKSRKATKMAKKSLHIAEQHLRSANKESFYLEISKVLYGYLADKLNISGAELSREMIASVLNERLVSSGTSSQLFSTLDTCEYARYAPGAVSGDLHSVYNNTVELITKIENEIK